jgi:hypothetical protein
MAGMMSLIKLVMGKAAQNAPLKNSTGLQERSCASIVVALVAQCVSVGASFEFLAVLVWEAVR